MASSRDVLNAFKAHVARLVESGQLGVARAAWTDFVANVVPSFPDVHRSEAFREFEAFSTAHPTGESERPMSPQ